MSNVEVAEEETARGAFLRFDIRHLAFDIRYSLSALKIGNREEKQMLAWTECLRGSPSSLLPSLFFPNSLVNSRVVKGTNELGKAGSTGNDRRRGRVVLRLRWPSAEAAGVRVGEQKLTNQSLLGCGQSPLCAVLHDPTLPPTMPVESHQLTNTHAASMVAALPMVRLLVRKKGEYGCLRKDSLCRACSEDGSARLHECLGCRVACRYS